MWKRLKVVNHVVQLFVCLLGILHLWFGKILFVLVALPQLPSVSFPFLCLPPGQMAPLTVPVANVNE